MGCSWSVEVLTVTGLRKTVRIWLPDKGQSDVVPRSSVEDPDLWGWWLSQLVSTSWLEVSLAPKCRATNGEGNARIKKITIHKQPRSIYEDAIKKLDLD
jgi:hypothetical protein